MLAMTAPTEQQRARTPPTGTVTFFFSDIEGSTRLVDALGTRYDEVLQRHRQLLRGAFADNDGIERGTEGDSFFVAFAEARDAVAAAVAATRSLAAASWPDDARVRVRIGLHTGEGRLVDGDYVGMDVHRAARIAAAGHGGQVLLSQSTCVLVERGLPAGVSLRDLGEHRLRDLPIEEHVYQVVIDGQPSEFPPIRSLARTVANLPAQLSTIVGRDTEVRAVSELLERSRLVTVTGAGGTGKTRLVQEVARAAVANGATDVTFVPLEALTDADLIPPEILRALRLDIAAARDPLDRLVEHLGDRRGLLVLDNLEQLPGVGPVVRSLLDRAPGLSVLTSSQAALHVAGEQEYSLDPLPVPPTAPAAAAPHSATDSEPSLTDNPAVRLFVDRARSVRADFGLDASNASAIAAIARRLDGLPLAIELAAAQVKLLSPDAILERIEGRLDALASRRADVPERQRTLRGTVAWSYDLLADPERCLFRLLSVFSGGARVSEIEAIAEAARSIADPLGSLETLVDRSLVTVRHGAGLSDRFGLLGIMRSYGRELLRDEGEEGPTVLRHAEIYRALARRAEPEFYGRARREWLDRLADDHDNLRAALDALESMGELEAAMDMAADLWRFWQQRGHLIEGAERLDRVLAAADAANAPAVSPIVRSRAEEAAGSILYWTRVERSAPKPFYERSLEYALASGDRRREAWARYNLAFVYDFTMDTTLSAPNLEKARELRAAALELFREVDDRRGIAESYWAMGGNALVLREDPARARQHLREALDLLTELGDDYGVSWLFISLGMLDATQGDLDAGRAKVLQAAAVFIRDGDSAGEIVALQALGSLAARRGDPRTAIRFSAAAEAAAQAIGAELPAIPPIIEPIKTAQASVSADDLRRETEIGRAIGAKSILMTAVESAGGESGP